MTLKELAKLANVSVATASKALGGSAELHPDTINTVLRIAEQCGYFSDKKRRRVSAPSYTAPTVAVVCPEIISSYYACLVTEIVRVLEERRASAIVYYTDFSDARTRDILNKAKVATNTFTQIKDEEQRTYLQKYAYACLLSYDIYMKRQMLERLIDENFTERKDEKKD